MVPTQAAARDQGAVAQRDSLMAKVSHTPSATPVGWPRGVLPSVGLLRTGGDEVVVPFRAYLPLPLPVRIDAIGNKQGELESYGPTATRPPSLRRGGGSASWWKGKAVRRGQELRHHSRVLARGLGPPGTTASLGEYGGRAPP